MIVQYWNCKGWESVSKLTRVETWEGNNEDIFRRFARANASLRYCNGSYYKFECSSCRSLYSVWHSSLTSDVKADLFYGNGTRD